MKFYSQEEVKVLLKAKHNKHRYYVYGLHRPDTDEIFYIGKGCNKRILSHLEINLYGDNRLKNFIIKKVGPENVKLLIKFVNSEEDAFEFERKIIERYKEHLCNRVMGGDKEQTDFIKRLSNSEEYILFEKWCSKEYIRISNNHSKKDIDNGGSCFYFDSAPVSVPKELFINNTLSLIARAVFCQLLSYNSWDTERLIKDCNGDKNIVEQGLKELKEKGYLKLTNPNSEETIYNLTIPAMN